MIKIENTIKKIETKDFKLPLLIALCLTLGCDVNNSFEHLTEEPYVVGEIIEVKERKDNEYSIRVAAETGAQQPSDDNYSIWFILTGKSEIFKETKDRKLSKLSADDLEVGHKVQGWPIGDVIATIYLQAEAGRIVVLEE